MKLFCWYSNLSNAYKQRIMTEYKKTLQMKPWLFLLHYTVKNKVANSCSMNTNRWMENVWEEALQQWLILNVMSWNKESPRFFCVTNCSCLFYVRWIYGPWNCSLCPASIMYLNAVCNVVTVILLFPRMIVFTLKCLSKCVFSCFFWTILSHSQVKVLNSQSNKLFCATFHPVSFENPIK